MDLPTTKYRIYSGNTIGLGHQLDFSKRSKIALLNKTEKENELAIVNKNLGTNSIEYNFYAKLFEAYKSRNEYMTAWSFFKWLNVFFQSLYFTGMYETVLMDLFSKIKG